MTAPDSVAVVGGGLAGITAALACADAGRSVTLYESRPKLGGLTHSFRRGELSVDNGQHVFLRCCTSYLQLLDRLGVRDLVTLQDRLDVPVVSASTGRLRRLRRSGLPAPLHLGQALARYGFLSPGERLRVVRAALALRRVDATAADTDATSFGQWLTAHHQSPRAIEAVWDLIGVATLNARAHDASLSLAATVFQIGLLGAAGAADIGWSRVPLQRLHGDAALAALTGAGVCVRTGAKVRSVTQDGAGWVIGSSGGPGIDDRAADQLGADDPGTDDLGADADRYGAVILALPAVATERLLPPGAVQATPGWSSRLGASPIINVHVVYDRTVMDEPFLAGIDSPIQWVFDRTDTCGLTDGQYLTVSLSAARDLVDRPVAELCAALLPEIARLLPRAHAARVLDAFVTRERQATFDPAPGSAASRLGARTRLGTLALAGAWTATGWPATMEGAVRSGQSAAEVVLTASAPSPRPAVAA